MLRISSSIFYIFHKLQILFYFLKLHFNNDVWLLFTKPTLNVISQHYCNVGCDIKMYLQLLLKYHVSQSCNWIWLQCNQNAIKMHHCVMWKHVVHAGNISAQAYFFDKSALYVKEKIKKKYNIPLIMCC